MIGTFSFGAVLNILFLCTGNSARSIIAEAIMNDLGKGRLHGFSAGNRPKGLIHPEAISLLERKGYSSKGLRSKSWVELSSPHGPSFDFVIALCSNVGSAAQPEFRGRAVRVNWDIPDPSTTRDPHAAFERTYATLLAHVGTLAFGTQSLLLSA